MSTHGIATSTEERALKLLGSGLKPETVASALGVSLSRISQLLSAEEFALKVAQLRYESLQKHNETDEDYDTLEKTLINRLKDVLPLMTRPMEILKAIQVVNAAKRRGVSSPEQIESPSKLVELTIPIQIINKFMVDSDNRVIEVEGQKLVTIQSGALLNQLKQRNQHVKQQIIQNTVGAKTASGS